MAWLLAGWEPAEVPGLVDSPGFCASAPRDGEPAGGLTSPQSFLFSFLSERRKDASGAQPAPALLRRPSHCVCCLPVCTHLCPLLAPLQHRVMQDCVPCLPEFPAVLPAHLVAVSVTPDWRRPSLLPAWICSMNSRGSPLPTSPGVQGQHSHLEPPLSLQPPSWPAPGLCKVCSLL